METEQGLVRELGGLDHYLFATVSILLPTLFVAITKTSTVVDCGVLSVTNGQVNTSSGTTYNQVATYSCDTGYNLVGSLTRTCQVNGSWSFTAPVCECESDFL